MGKKYPETVESKSTEVHTLNKENRMIYTGFLLPENTHHIYICHKGKLNQDPFSLGENISEIKFISSIIESQ